VGSSRQIERYARRRLDGGADAEEAAWWRSVIATLNGAVAAP
jgi:hypothetical protein